MWDVPSGMVGACTCANASCLPSCVVRLCHCVSCAILACHLYLGILYGIVGVVILALEKSERTEVDEVSLEFAHAKVQHDTQRARSLRPHIVTVCRCSRGQLLCPFSLSSLDAPGILRRGSRQKTWSLIGRNQRKHRWIWTKYNDLCAALTVLCALLKRGPWRWDFQDFKKVEPIVCTAGSPTGQSGRQRRRTLPHPRQRSTVVIYHISTPSQPPSLSTRLAERLPRRPRLTAARSLARPDRKGVARRGDGRGRGPKRGRRARTKGRCRRAATSRAKSWRRRRCAGRGATEPESGRRRGRSAVGKCRSPESSRRRAARARA